MAQQLSAESVKAINKFHLEDFSLKVFRAYIPSLPPTGREAATDLAKYCVVTGFLFRGWVVYNKAKERYSGLSAIVQEAIRRREERLESLKDGARADVEGVVQRESRIMLALAKKVQNTTGVV